MQAAVELRPVGERKQPWRHHFLGRAEKLALNCGVDPQTFHGLLPLYVRVFKDPKSQKTAHVMLHCQQPMNYSCESCIAIKGIQEGTQGGDTLYFEKVDFLRGKGETVLADYNDVRMMGKYYEVDDKIMFRPLDDADHPIVLSGSERAELRVIGKPKLLIRVL